MLKRCATQMRLWQRFRGAGREAIDFPPQCLDVFVNRELELGAQSLNGFKIVSRHQLSTKDRNSIIHDSKSLKQIRSRPTPIRRQY